jgi:hypothetical protein
MEEENASMKFVEIAYSPLGLREEDPGRVTMHFGSHISAVVTLAFYEFLSAFKLLLNDIFCLATVFQLYPESNHIFHR